MPMILKDKKHSFQTWAFVNGGGEWVSLLKCLVLYMDRGVWVTTHTLGGGGNLRVLTAVQLGWGKGGSSKQQMVGKEGERAAQNPLEKVLLQHLQLQ